MLHTKANCEAHPMLTLNVFHIYEHFESPPPPEHFESAERPIQYHASVNILF